MTPFLGNTYGIQDHSWVPHAFNDIKNKTPFRILINFYNISVVVDRITKASASVSKLPFVQHIISTMNPASGVSEVLDPYFIVRLLAVMGALGGVEGAIGVVIGAAHSHGCSIRVVFEIPDDLLSSKEYSLSIEMHPSVAS